MKEFLKRINLIEDWTTHLEISKQDFVNKLSAITEEREIGLFSDAFIPFQSSRKEYAGHVSFDEFKIKRRGRFFEQNQNMATALVMRINMGRMKYDLEREFFYLTKK